MATKPKNTTAKDSCETSLTRTQLSKLSVVTFLSPEESGKGMLQLAVHTSMLPSDKDKNSVVVRLEIKGDGLSGTNDSKEKIAFKIEAAIDGFFTLSRKPIKNEMQGCEATLANYLMPILSDMIETLLSKCGYLGIALPRSYPFKLEPVETVKEEA